MTNPLTGDFHAVMQLSGGTVNRLLATAHQNAFTDSKHPSFPHSVGADIAVGNTIGFARVQVASPRITLIDRSTNRFELEVGIRARYQPAPGSDPLPEYIHGTVSAVYRLEPVDPECPGWRTKAENYVWLRVEPDTVSFTGTAVDDRHGPLVMKPPDPVVTNARITEVLRTVLQHQFAATPHRVAKGFHPDSMIMLHAKPTQSAVALPVTLGGAKAKGSLASVHKYLLSDDGRTYDFALALSREAIMAPVHKAVGDLVGTQLDELRADYDGATVLSIGQFHAVWTPTITSATATWEGSPFTPHLGIIKVAFDVAFRATHVRTVDPDPIADYNFGVVVTEEFSVTFDELSQSVTFAPWFGPLVNFVGPFGKRAEAYGRDSALASAKDQIDNVIANVGAVDLSGATSRLTSQMRTLDGAAKARFDFAEFSHDGMVARGTIRVSARKSAWADFVRTDLHDGFDACAAWIPGGRIDRLIWHWVWDDPTVPDGGETEADRYILDRPADGVTTNFGVMTQLSKPLPGLDGDGTVCLTIEGVTTSTSTGALVPTSDRICWRYSGDVDVMGVLLLKSLPEKLKPAGELNPLDQPPVDQVVVALGRETGPERGANVLALRVTSGEWDPTIAETLRGGLEACRRTDAGLLVAVILPELGAERAELLRASVHRDLGDLPTRLLVTEDVEGTWSAALGLESDSAEAAWCLLTPTGGLSWRAYGELGGAELARVLDGHLFPSRVPAIRRIESGVAEGSLVSPWALDVDLIRPLVEHCPPPPVGRGNPATVVFVRPSASAAAIGAAIGRARGTLDDPAVLVAVVVDGVDAETAWALVGDHGDDVVAMGDRDRIVARRFGIRAWPSTVQIAEDGAVQGRAAPPGHVHSRSDAILEELA